MPKFELLLEGPAVPLRAAKKNAKRYQAWIQKVRAVARSEWPTDTPPIRTDVTVTITNFFTDDPPDIDNIIKPLLDALCLVVYEDDRQVVRVTSQKFDMESALQRKTQGPPLIRLSSASFDDEGRIQLGPINSVLAAGLERYKEVVYIEVVWY